MIIVEIDISDLRSPLSWSEGAMPIPELDSDYLPPGIYDCTMEEVCERFGTNDPRRELTDNLAHYMEKVRETQMHGYVIVNGSFVTSKEIPGDVDIILITDIPSWFSVTRSAGRWVFSTEYVRGNFKIHLFPAIEDTPMVEKMITRFSHIKEDPDIIKGLLRLEI